MSKTEQKPSPIPDFPRVTASVVRGPNRDGRWYWRIRSRDAARGTLWLGWATRAEVLIQAARLESEGRTASPSPASAVDERRLSSLLDKWVKHKETQVAAGQLSAQSLKTYSGQVAWWREAIGDVLIPHVQRAVVQDTMLLWSGKSETHTPAAARSLVNLLSVLGQVMKWGADRGLCHRPDLRGLEPDIDDDSTRVYTFITPDRDDVQAILRDPELRHEGADLAVRLMAASGCRVGETCAVTAADWNPRTRVLMIHGRRPGKGFTGKSLPRPVPIVDADVAAALTSAAAAGRELVSVPWRDIDGRIRLALRKACVRAGIVSLTPHALRRYAATQLALRGVPPVLACKILGHTLAYYLRVYCRPTSEDLRAALVQGLGEPTLIVMPGHRKRAQGGGDEDEGG